jgi:hypothetical protein
VEALFRNAGVNGTFVLSKWVRGNQRITRARLESFARGERGPDVWLDGQPLDVS